MSLRNISEVNTIQGPEFINLQPLDMNPLMEACEIKVFYLRNFPSIYICF